MTNTSEVGFYLWCEQTALPTTSMAERWTKYSKARKPKSAGYESTAATGPPAAPAEAKKMNNSTLPNEQ